jgi:hypothetical protein
MFGFVKDGNFIHAIPARAGAAFVSCGGILYPAREPSSADEVEAVRCLRRQDISPRAAIRRLTDTDAVALMAAKIVERTRACGAVERTDFQQAAIPEHMIEANRDAAFARARRLEPLLDGMAVAQ